MKVYRIVSAKYSQKLLASGRSGRWNFSDQFVIYTSENRSLATLELLVNISGLILSKEFKLLEINIPDDYEEIKLDGLPKDWKELAQYSRTQTIGSQWYQQNTSLILRVPSAIIPQEHNFIINTRNSRFYEVKITNIENYFWDRRLL